MKITIEHHDKKYTAEMPDDTNCADFVDELISLMSCVWHPETVKEFFVDE